MGTNILGFNGVVHSVVGDVPVDSAVPVVMLGCPNRKGNICVKLVLLLQVR